jgi:hypothetical protein
MCSTHHADAPVMDLTVSTKCRTPDTVILVHPPSRGAGTPPWTAIGSGEQDDGLAWHHSCTD